MSTNFSEGGIFTTSGKASLPGYSPRAMSFSAASPVLRSLLDRGESAATYVGLRLRERCTVESRASENRNLVSKLRERQMDLTAGANTLLQQLMWTCGPVAVRDLS